MGPAFSLHRLAQTKVKEYALRFVFGAAVALGAAAIGDVYGPRLGGLFLAFPALLPAALTLIEREEGDSAAADDARGAAMGSFGLLAFAVVVRVTAGTFSPWLTLGLALAAWVTVSASGWWLLLNRSKPGSTQP
jgi:hypothetical protein